MTEVKGVGRRRTQLLDDLRNRRRYWELKEEVEDRKGGNDGFLHYQNIRKKYKFSSISGGTKSIIQQGGVAVRVPPS
jgi:hypothetical protein